MPGARSTVERHPERLQIEARLRKGDPATHIARDFNLSRQAVDRFKVKLLRKPAGTGDDDRAAMMNQVRVLYNSTVDLMKKARTANAPRSFLLATGEARRCLTLMSKIIGVLNEAPPAPAVNVAVNVDLTELKSVILVALSDFPEARQACAAALVEYDDQKAGGEQ